MLANIQKHYLKVLLFVVVAVSSQNVLAVSYTQDIGILTSSPTIVNGDHTVAPTT